MPCITLLAVPQSLEIGANPATDDDAMHALVEHLREVRPSLQIHWRAGDDGRQAEAAAAAAAAEQATAVPAGAIAA